MPAPQALTIQAALKQGLLNKGFYKPSYSENGTLVDDKTELPDHMQKIVEGLSEGHAQWFAAWQAAQTVLIPVTSSPGLPSTGNLP